MKCTVIYIKKKYQQFFENTKSTIRFQKILRNPCTKHPDNDPPKLKPLKPDHLFDAISVKFQTFQLRHINFRLPFCNAMHSSDHPIYRRTTLEALSSKPTIQHGGNPSAFHAFGHCCRQQNGQIRRWAFHSLETTDSPLASWRARSPVTRMSSTTHLVKTTNFTMVTLLFSVLYRARGLWHNFSLKVSGWLTERFCK